jgi:hypothetical protein
MYEQLTLATAILRGWFITHTTLALLLYTFRVLTGPIIFQVALTALGALFTQFCKQEPITVPKMNSKPCNAEILNGKL